LKLELVPSGTEPDAGDVAEEVPEMAAGRKTGRRAILAKAGEVLRRRQAPDRVGRCEHIATSHELRIGSDETQTGTRPWI